MKNLYFITLLVAFSLTAQVESVTEVSVGGTSDFTNQPISPQSEFSHSQTIYYPEQLQFRGEINELRYRKAFSGADLTNTGNWVVRIGYTNKEEFTPGDGFIDVATLTEVSNGGYDTQNDEVIISLETPFVYDGLQNIVIDVQDLDPGFTTSATAGCRGSENFNNPPTRSLMTFSHMGSNSAVYQNSYARTQFGGNLERCPVSYSLVNEEFTETTASFSVINPTASDAYRYVVKSIDGNEPDPFTMDFELFSGAEFTIENLQPAQNYRLWYKSDCDEITTRYFQRNFRTAALPLSISDIIDFETPSGNYYRNESFGGFLTVTSEAALRGSTTGYLLNGSDNFQVFNQWSTTGDVWVTNDDFICRTELVLDVTMATQPVLQFDLQQPQGTTYLRTVIDDIVQEYEYLSTDVDATVTRQITIDLEPYIGKIITLELEHLARTATNKSYIDNITFIEAVCDKPTNIQVEATSTSLSLNWESTGDNWELDIVPYNELFTNTGVIVNSTSYTFDNLEVATPYDVYIRSTCNTDTSAWVRLFASTAPEEITIPYVNNFSNASEGFQTYALQLNRNSRIHRNFANRDLYLTQLQRPNGSLGWTGTPFSSTTEDNAWNDNKDYISGVTFTVDASTLASLEAIITYKQNYFYNPNTSWFRVLVNGEQVGPSYQPDTLRDDPFEDLIVDLTAYVGGLVTVTLQQSGVSASNSPTNFNSPNDLVVISAITFDGEEDVLGINDSERDLVSIYPNPTSDTLHFINSETIVSVEITDIKGVKIREYQIANGSLNVSNLETGLYIVKITSNTGIKTQLKFVKL